MKIIMRLVSFMTAITLFATTTSMGILATDDGLAKTSIISEVSKDNTGNKSVDNDTDKSSELDTSELPEMPEEAVNSITNIYQDISLELPLSWSALAGISCYNNDMPLADYRMTSDEFQRIKNRFQISVNGKSAAVIENLFKENDRRGYTETNNAYSSSESIKDLNTLSSEYAWLIKNNIISRVDSINLFSDDVTTAKVTDLDDQFTKSDLWMALYKIKWGVIPSRLAYVITSPVRNGVQVDEIEGYVLNGATVNAKFIGDWNVYAFPNVYELYFSELLNLGLLSTDEFSTYRYGGRTFLAGYKQLLHGNDLLKNGSKAEFPAWAVSLKPMCMNKEFNTCLLKDSYGAFWNTKQTQISRKSYDVVYFKNEKLTIMDSLKAIATFLRYTEERMTATEADIINYKYGIKYLNLVNEEDRDTVSLMIAKGILNFEDPNEFSNLYGKLTNEFAHKLLYRVANPDARYEFHKIQLTDSQNFWKARGYQETEIMLHTDSANLTTIDWDDVSVEQVPTNTTIEENLDDVENESLDTEGDLNLFSEGSEDSAVATTTTDTTTDTDTDEKLWKVVITDIAIQRYKYNGISLSKFDAIANLRFKQEVTLVPGKVVDLRDYVETHDRKGTYLSTGFADNFFNWWQKLDSDIAFVTFYKGATEVSIGFNVSAENAQEALALVHGRLKPIKLTGSTSITGVTRAFQTGNTKQEETMISSSMLSKLSTTYGDPLVIIKDNILQNTATGIMAILLPEQGVALVGNRVVKLENSMIFATASEVYYNVKVICLLMKNATLITLKDLDYQIIGQSYDTQIQEGSSPISVYSNSTADSTLLSNIHLYQLEKAIRSNTDNVPSNFLRLADISSCVNEVSTHYTSTKGNEYEIIVDWEYKVPDDIISDGETLDADSVVDAYNIAPTDSKYSTYWNNNLYVSNAITNIIYGTTGYTYFLSGWCVPKITILCYDNSLSDETILSDVFIDSGFLQRVRELGYTVKGTSWTTLFDQYCGRTLDIYHGTDILSFCTSFTNKDSDNSFVDVKYLVTKAGAIYKNIDFEERLIFVESSDGSITYGFLAANSVTYEEPKANTEIRVKLVDNTIQKFYYAGIISYKNKQYYALQPVPNKFTSLEDCSISQVNVSSDKLQPLMLSNKSQSSEIPNIFAKRWYSALCEGISRTDGLTDAMQYKVAYTAGTKLQPKYIRNSLACQILGKPGVLLKLGRKKVYETEFLGNFTVLSSNSNLTADSKIYTPIVLYLPVDFCSWSLTNSVTQNYYKIMNSKWAATLSTDYYTTGINEKIISMIYAEFLGAKKISDLKEMQTLFIGSIKFTVQGDKTLLSSPIKYKEDTTSLNLNNSKNLNKLYKVLSGISIRLGDVEVDFCDYVQSCIIESGWRGCNAGVKTLYYDNNDKLTIGVISADKLSVSAVAYEQGASFDEYRLRIKLADDLLCRPIDNAEQNFKLMPVAFDYSNGVIDTAPFSYEEIQLASEDYIDNTSTAYEFYEITDKQDLKDDFESEIVEVKKADVKMLILGISFVVMSLLLINCWASYFLLTKGLARQTLESISSIFVRKDGSRGFDLIKILTLNIYNLDDEPTVTRLIIASVFFVIGIVAIIVLY